MLILKTTLPGFNFVRAALAHLLTSQMTHLSKPFLPKILVGPLDTLDDSMKRINAVSKKLIEEKTGAMSGDEAAQGKDVLSLLVAANKGDDGQSYLNEQQMMDQVLVRGQRPFRSDPTDLPRRGPRDEYNRVPRASLTIQPLRG